MKLIALFLVFFPFVAQAHEDGHMAGDIALCHHMVNHMHDADVEYLAGRSKGRVSSVHIDSLAAMELCIEIEDCFGVSLTPQIIVEQEDLASLEERIFGS